MSELTIKKPPQVEDPAHIAAMIKVAETGQVAPPPAASADPERPAWLPEGFNTPEELAAAYAELQAGTKAETKPAEGEPAVTEEAAQTAAAEAVKQAGLDMDALAAKVVANGDISEEDYTALAEKGISKEMVKAFIDGQQAVGQAVLGRVYSSVGGEEAFNEMITWAGTNLSPAEVSAFNAAIDSNDEAQLMLAVRGLNASFTAAKGPALLGGRPNGGGTDVFESVAQMTAAMRDPRYSTDMAFQRAVHEKLARSSVI